MKWIMNNNNTIWTPRSVLKMYDAIVTDDNNSVVVMGKTKYMMRVNIML